MADLRFYGAQSDVVLFRIVVSKNHLHGSELRGVAGAGAGAVGFDQTDRSRFVAGIFVSPPHSHGLAGRAGRIDRFEAAVA